MFLDFLLAILQIIILLLFVLFEQTIQISLLLSLKIVGKLLAWLIQIMRN